MQTEIVWPAWLIAGLLTVLFYALMWRAGRRHRFLVDTPLSKAKGVFIGQVELSGRAVSEAPCRSWLAGVECVWYRYTIEEEWERWETETYTDKDGKTRTRQILRSGWTRIAEGGEAPTFLIEDETGAVQVRPAGAEVEPLGVFSTTARRGDALYSTKTDEGPIANSTGRRRFSESAIPLNTGLFVSGYAGERTDVVAPEIARNEAQEMFLISCKGEARVQRGYRLQFWSFGVLSLLGLPVAGLIQEQSSRGTTEYFVAAGLLAFMAAVWFAGWLWMAFNSLVQLRNRTAQARSLIDIQLKRRADLIPRLVEVVRGLRDHENRVQVEVTTLRAQAVATPVGQPGPDFDKTAPAIAAIAEHYPQLKTSDAFRSLQRELADTETRIALARDYHNSIATHLNIRLEIVPDRWFSPLAGLKPQSLFTAEQFEREPVRIGLSTP